jgi:uncharacterized membrane protein
MISIWGELIRFSAGRMLLLFLYSLARSSLRQYMGCSGVQGREGGLIVIIMMVIDI